jgi:O-antigen ligase
MLLALLIGAILSSIFGLYQYFGDILGLPVQYTGLRDSYTYALFGFPRVQSTGLEPLYFASYLLLPTSIIVAIILTKTKLIRFTQKTTIATLILFSLLIFLTVSRGAIYGLVAMVMFMIAFTLFKKIGDAKKSALVILAVVIGFSISWLLINYLNTNPSQYFSQKRGAEVYTDQITNTTITESGDERAIARGKAIGLIKQQELSAMIGIGPGQYGPYVMNNQPDVNGWTIVNNEPLELILELGIFGFVIFATFALYIFIQALRLVPLKDPLSSATLIGILGYLVAETIQYQSFSTLYITHIWVAIGLLIGITRVANEQSK